MTPIAAKPMEVATAIFFSSKVHDQVENIVKNLSVVVLIISLRNGTGNSIPSGESEKMAVAR